MADPNERYDDHEEAFRMAFEGLMAGVFTGMPCIVESVNYAAETCVLQPAIQGVFRATNGSISFNTMTLLVDVPLYFSSGGGLTFTLPVKKGDEAFAAFSQRCIDSWWQNGGVQPPAELRMHDPSDAFAFVGFRSQPRANRGISSDSAQIIADNPDGGAATVLFSIDGTNGAVFNCNVAINGNQTISENQTVNGSQTVVGDILGDGVNLKTHQHSGVQTGSGNTGAPI